ncbi:hypothetical protein JNJ66_06635 [Candidatus Saccharibacteria bacterium]|nr:hypothetical protein [Candidatus Saccharibacteria bacterium]
MMMVRRFIRSRLPLQGLLIVGGLCVIFVVLSVLCGAALNLLGLPALRFNLALAQVWRMALAVVVSVAPAAGALYISYTVHVIKWETPHERLHQRWSPGTRSLLEVAKALICAVAAMALAVPTEVYLRWAGGALPQGLLARTVDTALANLAAAVVLSVVAFAAWLAHLRSARFRRLVKRIFRL